MWQLPELSIPEERTAPSLSLLAYQQIQHKLVTLALPPGELINEGALQSELGLGRTPVREALLRLSREQLVEIVPRRGIFATEIDLTDLQRLFEMRLPLECLAVELATQRATPSQWQEINRLVAETSQAHSQTASAWLSHDRACHELIYAATDNKFLSDPLTKLYILSLRIWFYAIPAIHHLSDAVQEHIAIFQAMQAHQPALASQRMSAHIRGFQAQLQMALVERMGIRPTP
ncbi:MAG TPA: GntR family transcriptional regulator [Anaerolineales bacterium]|nr:GntR family transcriptional regulator [Anaerolineales bacterium]